MRREPVSRRRSPGGRAILFLALALALVTARAQREGNDSANLDRVVAGIGPYTGESFEGVDTSTLSGKVMCGYQGWFRTADSNRPWFHYRKGKSFEPGNCTIDLWPDLEGFGPDERYATPFVHEDGRTAEVFSSLNKKTVLRHFEWMRQYGIDGVFVQRFTSSTRPAPQLREGATVLAHCREGANLHGRAYAVMYDTDFDAPALAQVRADWKRLVDGMRITSDSAYLRHEGKPVVALWGCGFNDRAWDAEAAHALMDFLKNDPVYGGLTIMLGVPTHWLKLEGDSRDDDTVHEIIQKADIVSPWMVGRSRTPEDAAENAGKYWKPEIEWCRNRDMDFLPVAFPGFSWHNMYPENPIDQIPRLGGTFLWRQFLEAARVDAGMLYVAMFDEIDEATAIFKCTNDPPAGASPFLTYGGLPSDHYLWLTGMGGKLIRGEIEASDEIPRRETGSEAK